ISDATVTEGNSGTIDATFNVQLSTNSSQLVSVRYATGDGTATDGADYGGTNGVVNFLPGVTNQTITVQVIGDLLSEADETFFVNLSSSTNAVISDPQGMGTIVNDDCQPSMSINDVSGVEGAS